MLTFKRRATWEMRAQATKRAVLYKSLDCRGDKSEKLLSTALGLPLWMREVLSVL